jgi:hypothetical protein
MKTFLPKLVNLTPGPSPTKHDFPNFTHICKNFSQICVDFITDLWKNESYQIFMNICKPNLVYIFYKYSSKN